MLTKISDTFPKVERGQFHRKLLCTNLYCKRESFRFHYIRIYTDSCCLAVHRLVSVGPRNIVSRPSYVHEITQTAFLAEHSIALHSYVPRYSCPKPDIHAPDENG